jgi:hypothetical protein
VADQGDPAVALVDQVAEHRLEVVDERRRAGTVRAVDREAEPPLVRREDAVRRREGRDLLPPGEVVAAEPVEEDDRRSLPVDRAAQVRTVDGDAFEHGGE